MEGFLQFQTIKNESECPCDILMTEDEEVLCHWLCIFVMEVRKESGDPYTPRSIVQLMSGLNLRYHRMDPVLITYQ